MVVELTEQEQVIILEALHHYYDDAEDQLQMSEDKETLLPLSVMKQQLLEKRKELVLPLLTRFENL